MAIPITFKLPEAAASVTSQCITVTNTETNTPIVSNLDVTIGYHALDLEEDVMHSITVQDKVSGVASGDPVTMAFNSGDPRWCNPTITALCGADPIQ